MIFNISLYLHMYSQLVNDKVQYCSQRRSSLQSQASDLREQCRQQISSATLAVEQKIAVVMKDVLEQLGSVVDGYKATFVEDNPVSYKDGLYIYVNEKLEQKLAMVGSTALSELHNEAPKFLIGEE